MNLSELKKYALKMANENPTLKEEIWDFVQLAIDEIEEGGSMQHECSLAQRDIEELINTMKVEESNSPGAEEMFWNGYSNEATYTMISHIHNDRDMLETAFNNIREYNCAIDLKNFFREDIFHRRTLANEFGLMTFNKINWIEIFDNLKVMMRVEKFTIGDYLMIVDGSGLKFDWEGKIFKHDCTYTEAFDRAEEICVWDCANDKVYNVNQNRFVKVNHEWRFIPESDRWISEWTNDNNKDVVAVNYFQGSDSFSHFDLKNDFFLPDPQLTEKVLAKKMNIDDAIWSVIHEENISKEDLVERLALANIQARILFDQLHKLGDGISEMVEELSHAHNIKLLTDISTDEWKYRD